MTSNQIANRANEITEEYNHDQVRLKQESNDIARQSNNITERYNASKLLLEERSLAINELSQQESVRHNQATENIQTTYNDSYLNYLNRYGDEQIALKYAELDVSALREKETQRHNKAMEDLEQQYNSAKMLVAETDAAYKKQMSNISLQQLSLSERIQSWNEEYQTKNQILNTQVAFWNKEVADNRLSLDAYLNMNKPEVDASNILRNMWSIEQGQQQIELQQQEMALAQSKFEETVRMDNTSIAKSYAGVVLDAIKTANEVAKSWYMPIFY